MKRKIELKTVVIGERDMSKWPAEEIRLLAEYFEKQLWAQISGGSEEEGREEGKEGKKDTPARA